MMMIFAAFVAIATRIAASGTTDVLLPLPDGLPCDNVTLVGTNPYATSGERVFQRYVQVGECDKIQCTPQTKIGDRHE